MSSFADGGQHRTGGWIQTFTGKQFWPLDARDEDITIEDIAHALACTARFGGHTAQFYSVAQHSVLVSHACKPANALWGLMHDAAEAYLGDVPRPIKHGPGMEEFRAAEKRLQSVVLRKYHLISAEPEDVRWADAAILATERRDLMQPLVAANWHHGADDAAPLSGRIIPLSAHWAEDLFLERFNELWPTDGGW